MEYFIITLALLFLGAIFSAVGAVISVTVIMMLANMVITPLYTQTTTKEVVQMIPTLLLPFNFAKSLMNVSVMLIIYKPLTSLLRQMGLMKTKESNYRFGMKAIILTVIAAAILIASSIFIINVLNGEITIF